MLARWDIVIWVPTIPIKVLGALALPELDGLVSVKASCVVELLPSCRMRSIRKRRELITLLQWLLINALGWRVEGGVSAHGVVHLADVDD